jgi:hypothetical protein
MWRSFEFLQAEISFLTSQSAQFHAISLHLGIIGMVLLRPQKRLTNSAMKNADSTQKQTRQIVMPHVQRKKLQLIAHHLG